MQGNAQVCGLRGIRYCDLSFDRRCADDDDDGLSYASRLRKVQAAWDNVDDGRAAPLCKSRSWSAVKDDEDVRFPLVRSLVVDEMSQSRYADAWAEKPNVMPKVLSVGILSDLSTDAGSPSAAANLSSRSRSWSTPSMSILIESDDVDSDQLDLCDESPPPRACCGRLADIVVDYDVEEVQELFRKVHEADRREPCYRFPAWVKPPEGKKCFPRY
jgi:hypothetical protein